ncbi:protein of unknown function [Saccharopolyspora kobensis]|uniref:DUF4253 domain-containing protein n=1 Tax=Saccharopolyspora kobensis TaxID=146035 RepID=A0A1H6ECL9_9PSEU|nr:DUF4253 domain-containing protein [Saccharopolyspora kobensis]SEG95011.1 protein of unknown function [Saccharopolyspora kobensis]SFD61116.1 protein of unknown function [Saccharopolyspora kobensis]
MLRDDREAGAPADLSAVFGTGVSVPLPPGEILTEQTMMAAAPAPLCWISDEPPAPQLVAALRAEHRQSGLWPLLLCDNDEVYGERCTVGVVPPEPLDHIDRWRVVDVMARIWDGLVQADDELGPAYDLEVLAPFDYHCPGPAPAGNLLADPDILANQQLPKFIDEDIRLALIPVHRGADVLTALGWSGAANHVSRTAGLSAMARSWEERFGARLLRLGPDRLDLSVAAPPQDPDHAAAVAAEHWTFCPDRILQETGTIEAYAQEIRGRRTWSFWWE